MKWRAHIIVTIIIHTIILDWTLANDNDINKLSNDNYSTSTDEDHHKFLLECQHSDYRTYIKCLKREKRHHGHDHHNNTGHTDFSRTCFEDCGIDQCLSTKCVHDCHTRCMKKTKETRQIITQYETECTTGDCNNNKSELPITNITTNVDINNIINNHIATTDNNRTIGSNNKCIPGNCCDGCCGGCSQAQNNQGFGLSLVPQIQLVPQITYSIGIGPIGGCLFSMNWPCLQSTQNINQQISFDCSQCDNPFHRYRCETSCNHNGNNRSMCKSPNCIGGIQ